MYSTAQLILECYWLDGEIKGPKQENTRVSKDVCKGHEEFLCFQAYIGLDSINIILYTAVILVSAGSKKK